MKKLILILGLALLAGASALAVAPIGTAVAPAYADCSGAAC